MGKENEFAAKLISALNEVINKEGGISMEEIEEHTNAFFHAIGNLAPAVVYQKLVDSNADLIACNHAFNRLLIQFIQIDNK